MPGDERHDYSGCNCETDAYGFLQGQVAWMSTGSYQIAPGVTVELMGKETVRFQTDEFGEFLEKLPPGKYCIHRVYGKNGTELKLLPGYDRCVKVKKKDCVAFYVYLK